MTYKMQEAFFDLPAPYLDQTVTVLTVPTERSDPLRILVTRSDVADDMTVDAFAEREIAHMRRTIDGFERLWERSYTLDGYPARILASHIDGTADPVTQRHLFVINNGKAMTFCFSVPGQFTEKQMVILRRITDSFRFTPQPGVTP